MSTAHGVARRPTSASARPQAPQLAGRSSKLGPPDAKARVSSIVALVVFVVVLRAGGLGRPLLGSFATKNVVYAMIAKNWVEGRAPIWRPTVDCLVEGERGCHLLEVPIAAYLAGIGWQFLGGSLDVWGRATSMVFSAFSVVGLYLLVLRWHGHSAALAAAAMLACAPASIFLGQCFMLESSVVAFGVWALLSLDRYLELGRSLWLGALVIAAGACLLSKFFMLAWLLPMVGIAHGWRARLPASTWRRRSGVALFAIGLAMAPALFWVWWVFQVSNPTALDGPPLYYSLRHSASVHGLPYPLLFSGGFWFGVAKDTATIGLGPAGFLLALIGLRRGLVTHCLWLLAGLALVLAMPAKFERLNYYYLLILPPCCILAGLGWEQLRRRGLGGRWLAGVTASLCLLGGLRYAAGPAWVTPDTDRNVPRAGAALAGCASNEERIVTLHDASPALLYYCRRPGWVVNPAAANWHEKLSAAIEQGARYVVVAGPGMAHEDGLTSGDFGLRMIERTKDYGVFRTRMSGAE